MPWQWCHDDVTGKQCKGRCWFPGDYWVNAAMCFMHEGLYGADSWELLITNLVELTDTTNEGGEVERERERESMQLHMDDLLSAFDTEDLYYLILCRHTTKEHSLYTNSRTAHTLHVHQSSWLAILKIKDLKIPIKTNTEARWMYTTNKTGITRKREKEREKATILLQLGLCCHTVTPNLVCGWK